MKITKENPETVKEMFNNIAHKYDRTNGIISLGCHKIWNRKLIKVITSKKIPERFLDLCSGTGEITYELIKRCGKTKELFLLDFSYEMLSLAKKKLAGCKRRLHFLQADCRDIPLPRGSIDCVTIAYGIRNIKEPKTVINECYRVLEDGGGCAILELTRPHNHLVKSLHKIYLKTLLPLLGAIFTRRKDAYRYLCKTIEEFISPKDLVKMMEEAGFQNISTISLLGGIATIIFARKAPTCP